MLLDAWGWFTNPSVAGWIGIVAAVAAAFAVSPRPWLAGPIVFMLRALLVIIVWVAVVLILTSLTPRGLGGDSGPGVDKGETASEDAPSEKESGTVVIKELPGSDAPQPAEDIVIHFVASKSNETKTQRFACDLVMHLSDMPATLVEIRSTDSKDFYARLTEQLQKNKLQSHSGKVSVRIDTTPYPGEPALRKIQEVLLNLNQDCDITLGE